MIELNQILLADCMDVMAEMPDNYFELAIVDVNYGIGESNKDFGSRGKLARADKYERKDWDNEPPKQEYFTELLRVSQNQIVWGANHFIELIPYNSPAWIVWDKDNGDNDFADCELAWTSFKTAVRKIRYRWNGMLQEDMKNKEHRIHPTQKPVKLYKWLLQKYAKAGDKILDTHAGSCSSVIACIDMGFDYLAIEKDADYHAQATKRVNDFKAQTNMFRDVS